MNNDHKASSRITAANTIARWLETEDFPDRLLPADVPDRAFVLTLVYGSIRMERALSWMIEQFASSKQEHYIKACLLIGLYQLFFMDNVAEYAAINETVEAAKAAQGKKAAGFINGVLRRSLREKDMLMSKLDSQPLGVKESHPDILVKRWLKNLSAKKTRKLLEHNNTPAKTCIRLNELKTSILDYQALLTRQEIKALPHPFAPESFLILPRGCAVSDLPGYKDGVFTVQDPSTSVAVQLLDPQPGEIILDACAAPGGKTSIIAEKMQGKGTLFAADVYEDRIERLKENVSRMGYSSVSIVQADAVHNRSIVKACREETFDRILLDVPCSNTGVLRRRPDARWRFTYERLSEVVRLQKLLLNSAGVIVKPGGTLVYSTCSIEPEEGSRMIESWLKEQDGFELKDSIVLFPPKNDTDGIYAAALVKRG